ncbi:protein phosphatase 1 regulatory subunit 14C-like [Sinocyclocheilus grahami]|uniref:protein phosphatase 1 regulatory subunit 14C-like n=1 Tax=Sinocyclocheilus grahami TaxID=75366 RepID=UPI0007ACDF16|nr:PREDICTED: protein phosphatase 1 regulatory subunit 14C-like [Sinocyclocheilus grahami]
MASEPGTQSRVMFQTKEEEPAQRKLGKLTVKYNRKDLQRRLDIEEWIDGQLRERPQDFINGLLYRMKGLRKMSGSLKK